MFLFYTPNYFFTRHWRLAGVNFTPCPYDTSESLAAALLSSEAVAFGVFLYEVTCTGVWIETDFKGSNASQCYDVAKIPTVGIRQLQPL